MALFQRSGMWRDVSPTGAIGDLITVFRQAGPNRWWVALAAAATTIGIFSVMAHEEVRGKPPRPHVTYITTWRAGRSEAEIVAGNIANQQRKDQLAAEQAKREEDVRQMYKTLGRMSGMDVDAIEKKAMADRAADEARAGAPAAAQRQRREQAKPAGE